MRNRAHNKIFKSFRAKILCIIIALLSLVISTNIFAASDNVIRLSSLDLNKMTAGWGKAVVDKSIESKTLSIGGKTFDNGVGTHAGSVLYVDLYGQAERFAAQVGVDDETGGKGSVQFKIYGDGEKLFDSGVMKGGDKARGVDVNLRKVKQLILVVTEGDDDIHYDHADWADAYFEYKGTPPEAIEAPVEKEIILTPRAPLAPKINGPEVYGARRGNPFVYRIPATGKRPMVFSAKGLPRSLKLDNKTGIITGTTPKKAGEYTVVLNAKNSHGKDKRQFNIVAGDTLALTPPMGWNSWYIHYNRVTEQNMRDAADAMISSGMADYGYQYVNIDDCWSKKKGDKPYRDSDGSILANAKFGDMKALTGYIHSKGLKAGIYTSPGPWNCAGYVGSYEYELIDALKFAEWGFDFLKYDWCSYWQVAKGQGKGLTELQKPYIKMSDILKGLDRDIVLNLCQYGMGEVWKWGGEVGGNCWRTTGDLGWMSSFYEVGLSNARHYKYAKPGQWNDPDYILIGWVGSARKMGEGEKTGLTPNEQYSYMSMWSLMSAPLIFSGDMTKLDDFTVNVLCNSEVIEVNQDRLGKQAPIIEKTDEYFIMLKDLYDGSKALGVFNTSEVELDLETTWAKLGIEGKWKVRDLWRQKDVGVLAKQFETTIPRHGVALVRLSPVDK